jgi:dTDP-4-amino-4,6-dideoxygalactose transaminase
MTPSCTAALEMAAMICDLGPGDEVIMPSYTFVTTASAFVRAGVKPVFVDIRQDTLNLDESRIEAAITERTRAIVPVHYAGVACEMDTILEIAAKHNLFVIEDAAQGVNATYKGRALGSLGHLGCYSFHSTKNYGCGEGGALCINDPSLVDRADIIRDKGTNRRQFFAGNADKYTWVETGSSYVPAEVSCALLRAQLEELHPIQARRSHIYHQYRAQLAELAFTGAFTLPVIPENCASNFHLFHLMMNSESDRNQAIKWLNDRGIQAVFHYVPLHDSPMGRRLGTHMQFLPVTQHTSQCLVRLPLFYELPDEAIARTAKCLQSLFNDRQRKLLAA